MSATQELAQETIGILKGYLTELAPLSRRLSNVLRETGRIDMTRLIDAISLVIEASHQINEAMNIRPSPTTALEKDLSQVLDQLLKALERRDRASQVSILGTDLPRELERWSGTGVIELERCISASP